jgi:hypothetical protein
LFDQLNREYWPVSYRNMRRLADAQNLVFRNFAARNGLPFIDLAAEYPQDPLLFDDGVHMKYPGLRLQAWIYLQHLAPMLESLIRSGALPRKMRYPRDVHPAFANQPEPRVVTLSEIRAGCPAS